MGIFDLIASFLAEHGIMVSTVSAVTIIGGVASYFLFKKVIPAATNTLLGFISQVIGKMFGLPSEGVSDTIKELPIVKEMKQWELQMVAQNELKLIDYKKLLVSAKLSDAERVAYQAMFDKILNELGDKISYATLKALDAIEKSAKEQLSL